MTAKPTMADDKFPVDVSLDKIVINPFQPRSFRPKLDTIHRAISILSNSLLQPPSGRRVGADIQLAFGAGRFMAFCMISGIQKRLQNDQSALPGEWGIGKDEIEATESFQELVALASAKLDQTGLITTMPVFIRDLSDRQMFEQAVSENHDRTPLPPVDLGNSMLVYRDPFNATADEIGRLYHMSGSAARNLMRLPALSEGIRERVNSGSLSRGQANKLLTLQSIRPDLAEKAAGKIVAEQSVVEVDRVIEQTLSNDKNTVLLWPTYKPEPALAGYGLWQLDQFTPPALRSDLDAAKLIKEFPQYVQAIKIADDGRKPADALAIMIEWVSGILSESESVEYVRKTFMEVCANDEDLRDFVITLIHPPLCLSCPFQKSLNGNKYCTRKTCFDWKSEQWTLSEANQISETLGVPMLAETETVFFGEKSWPYGVRSDGSFGKLVNPFSSWLADKNPDLRVRVVNQSATSGNFPHTDSTFAQLVLVGETAESLYTAALALLNMQPEGEKTESITIDWRDNQNPNKSDDDAPVYFQASCFVWDNLDPFLAKFEEISDLVLRLLVSAMSSDEQSVYNQYEDDYYSCDDDCEPEIFWRMVIAHKAIMAYLDNETASFQNCELSYVIAAMREAAPMFDATLPDDWGKIA